MIEETEKETQNKSLINQLSKTIAENSKVLGEFGISPPVLSKIKSLIVTNYNAENNNDDEEIKRLWRHENLVVSSSLYVG